jgi:hypothetical protein
MKLHVLGIDLDKTVFHAMGLDPAGRGWGEKNTAGGVLRLDNAFALIPVLT